MIGEIIMAAGIIVCLIVGFIGGLIFSVKCDQCCNEYGCSSEN